MKTLLKKARDKFHWPIFSAIAKLEAPCLGSLQIQQKLLAWKYRELAEKGLGLPPLHETEYRVFSQNGEDGIIAFLFALVGTEHKRFFEIGIETGIECNAANLAINDFWDGWFVEGNPEMAQAAARYYSSQLNTWPRDIRVIESFVTKENVNFLVEQQGIASGVDFFSLDIDGIDWWVWHEMKGLSPRIVSVEYNASFGPDLAVTVPYKPDFERHREHASGFYHGASLRAFTQLGQEKGYRFVGCNSTGANAFFVRNDLAGNVLPAVAVEHGYRPSSYRNRRMSLEQQLALLQELPLVSV
jgi:hypothetical protein